MEVGSVFLGEGGLLGVPVSVLSYISLGLDVDSDVIFLGFVGVEVRGGGGEVVLCVGVWVIERRTLEGLGMEMLLLGLWLGLGLLQVRFLRVVLGDEDAELIRLGIWFFLVFDPFEDRLVVHYNK